VARVRREAMTAEAVKRAVAAMAVGGFSTKGSIGLLRH